MRTLAEKRTAVNCRKCTTCGARPGIPCKKINSRTKNSPGNRLPISGTHAAR